MTFADYTKGFRNSTPMKHRTPTTTHSANSKGEEKRRQLMGQMARIIQELLNLQALSDTDSRILSISSAVAYLLAGR